MNKISTSIAGLLLVLLMPFTSQVLAQESAVEAAESKCVLEAEELGITDDKFDDYVSSCIEKEMANN